MPVERAHGHGNAEGLRATNRCGYRAGLPKGPSHPFYQRLNRLLDEHEFPGCGGTLPAILRQAARAAEPGAGVYFRLRQIGYFEEIDSERGIAWRAQGSPGLRRFQPEESPPDHSTVSRTRRRIDVETHREVFGRVLRGWRSKTAEGTDGRDRWRRTRRCERSCDEIPEKATRSS